MWFRTFKVILNFILGENGVNDVKRERTLIETLLDYFEDPVETGFPLGELLENLNLPTFSLGAVNLTRGGLGGLSKFTLKKVTLIQNDREAEVSTEIILQFFNDTFFCV